MPLRLNKLAKHKADVSDQLFRRFKQVHGLKTFRAELVAQLRRRRRSLPRPVAELLQQADALAPAGAGLAFRVRNRRDVFARVKRKSSYGRTLQEKQKLQAYLPGLTRHQLKLLYQRHRRQLLGAVERLPLQLLNRTQLFESRRALLHKFFFARGVVASEGSQPRVDFGLGELDRLRIPRLEARPPAAPESGEAEGGGGAGERAALFDRPLSAHLLLDLRLFKVGVVGSGHREEAAGAYPFPFQPRRLLQHFRLKRA